MIPPRLRSVVVATLSCLLLEAPVAAQQTLPIVVPNDNRVAGGELNGGELTIRLDAIRAMWLPDAGPGETMHVFAEQDGAPRIPGPLLRVPVGTRVRALVHNSLTDTLRVHGLHAHPATEAMPLRVAPGETGEVSFDAGAPGTYFYWGATSDSAIDTRYGPDTQLSGGFVVDSANAARDDRVFVITSWFELADTLGPEPRVPRDMFAINGLSWPHTERFRYTAGDTVRWRWISPAGDGHPMHLHGFYFDMLSRGDMHADTVFAANDARRAVTETMQPGSTMTLRFVAERPGNWLFHCHFAFHVSHFLSFRKIPDHEDPLAADGHDHSVHGMAGLILAMNVQPRPGEEMPVAPRDGRRVRLHVNAARDTAGAEPRLGYVVEEGAAPAPDSVPAAPGALVLRTDEPVLITVVNNLRAPTAVHWHGIEVEDSYADGVPGFGGTPSSITPLIAPGDSFVAAFTPPRAGTFIFHSHANELVQMTAGLAAPLIVVDDPAAHAQAGEQILLVTANGLQGDGVRLNGSVTPEPLRIAAHGPTRLRIVSIDPDVRVDIALLVDGQVGTWRPLAKDGADLPPHQATERAARVLMGPGETWDFELRPAAGAMSIVVAGQVEDFRTEVPIRVR